MHPAREVAGHRPGRRHRACAGRPELISRDVEPYGAIACVRQNPPIAASPAGYIQADPVVADAEAFPQESFFFLVMEGREGFVVPFGMAVISRDL